MASCTCLALSISALYPSVWALSARACSSSSSSTILTFSLGFASSLSNSSSSLNRSWNYGLFSCSNISFLYRSLSSSNLSLSIYCCFHLVSLTSFSLKSSLCRTCLSFSAIRLFISTRKLGSGTNSRLSLLSESFLMLDGGSISSMGFFYRYGVES